MTVYEYDINRAAAEPNVDKLELIKRVRRYPDDLGMGSMRPSDFKSLIVRIRNSESEAMNYYNKMCNNADCTITSCDSTCRNDLACVLENSS